MIAITGRPARILVLADVPGWAWAKKAEQIKLHLDVANGGEFEIDIGYTTNEPPRADYDLYHTFEFPQTTQLPVGWRKTTGITAHVWQTWNMRHGPNTVKGWASTAVAVHANSILLQKEMEEHLGRPVYYVPNGVDEMFYRRLRPRASAASGAGDEKLVVGWVGKPNPRKGRAIVEEACAKAGVEFRYIERTYRDALGPEQMREWYQDIHVLAVASDMDGTPNPALEAAACECAVVSNEIGNMPEFIDPRVNGYLAGRDVASMACVFQYLSKHVGQAIEMGKAARTTIENDWTWKKMAQHYATMWRDVLAGKAA